MKKLILLFITAMLFLSSCNKDEVKKTESKPSEFVLDSIQRDFTREISNGSNGQFAVGYDFWVTDSGVINQLALITPSTGSYKVYIENTDTEKKDSATINITVADTGKVIYKSINPMIANAGNYFRISFNDLDKPQYQYIKAGGMNHLYGHIRLKWYVFQQTTSSVVGSPFGHSMDYTFGGVGFTYIKN